MLQRAGVNPLRQHPSSRLGASPVIEDDGWLVQPLASVKAAREYFPTTEPGLLPAFLNVRTPEDARAFFERYGPLGYHEVTIQPACERLSVVMAGRLRRRKEWGQSDDERLFAEYAEVRRRHGARPKGLDSTLEAVLSIVGPTVEPFQWILDESELAGWCWRAGSRARGEQDLRVCDAKPYPALLRVQGSEAAPRWARGDALPWQPRYSLRSKVSQLVGEHLRHVHWQCSWPRDQRATLYVSFQGRALIDELYYLMAERLHTGDDTGSIRLVRCRRCQTYFETRDSRSEYCPPRGDSTAPSGKRKSRCYEAAHQEELRKRRLAQGLTGKGKPRQRALSERRRQTADS